MSAIIKILLYLALVIVLVGVALANADQQVDVTYFPGRTLTSVPVFLVILGSVFIGVLVAGCIAVVEHFKHGMRERELRNLPISSSFTDSDGDEADWPGE